MKPISYKDPSTWLGMAICLLSFTSYFFNIPHEAEPFINVAEFGIGLVLWRLPAEDLALDVWEMIKKKLNK